jgi:hypothetical protein
MANTFSRNSLFFCFLFVNVQVLDYEPREPRRVFTLLLLRKCARIGLRAAEPIGVFSRAYTVVQLQAACSYRIVHCT